MVNFFDLPPEIRFPIYEDALGITGKSLCYEISTFGCYEAENSSNYQTFDAFIESRRRYWSSDLSIKDRFEGFAPLPHFIAMISVCQQASSEIQDLVYSHVTFQLRFGYFIREVPHSWYNDHCTVEDSAQSTSTWQVTTSQLYRRYAGITSMETQALHRLTKLSLVIGGTFVAAGDRLRLSKHLRELATVISQRAQPLQLLSVRFKGFRDMRYHYSARDESSYQFQYLLEALATIHAEQAVVEGTVEPDFARKLVATIEAGTGRSLEPIDYGFQSITRRRPNKVVKSSVQRTKRCYFEPMYDWTGVKVP